MENEDNILTSSDGLGFDEDKNSMPTPDATSISHLTGDPSRLSRNSVDSYSDERFHLIYQREARWAEVRKYSEYIRRFANADVTQMDITKENYYDLYNMAVCLLKSIDGLDPDKMHSSGPMPGKRGELIMSPSTTAVISHAPSVMVSQPPELVPGRRSYDYIAPYRGFVPGYAYPGEYMPTIYEAQPARRRVTTPARRNLQCNVCGVTKTPEWRRGPSGDHTLCNACGLQYAKSLKKQRKEKERKAQQQQQEVVNIIHAQVLDSQVDR